MGFLQEMLSSEAKISSKRTVGFAAFVMLMASWGADTFSGFEVKDKILDFEEKMNVKFEKSFVSIFLF